MKRLSKEEKDQIQRWEDIPLSDIQLYRYPKVLNEDKILRISDVHKHIEGEDLKKLQSFCENGKISIELEWDDYDPYLETILLIEGDFKNKFRPESDEEYEERMNLIKKREFKNLLNSRQHAINIEKENEKKKKKKAEDEYKQYLKLKEKFEK